MIGDCARYRGGHRVGGRLSVAAAARDGGDDTFAWVDLVDPPAAEVRETLASLDLPEGLADAMVRHQDRSLLRFADHVVQMVLRTSRYVEAEEVVEFGQVGVVVAEHVAVVVRVGEVDDLAALRDRLEGDPTRLARGPTVILAAIVAAVLDSYPKVLEGIAADIEEVESVVFSDSSEQPTKRIYDLNRELLELRRAIGPLLDAVAQLGDASHVRLAPPEAQHFRQLVDAAERTMQSVESNSDLLANALSASLTQVSLRQNEDMRKISAWAAILAVPTMLAGIYGMNFRHMPELRQSWGYPVVLGVMALACFVLYRRFKRIEWL